MKVANPVSTLTILITRKVQTETKFTYSNWNKVITRKVTVDMDGNIVE